MSGTTRRTGAGAPSEILTFLIADVRGYTRFTQARGDEAAAKLARAFADIAREGVEARGGSVIELRGDEALAVFGSARQALRAAVDLQHVFADEVELDPSLPLCVGIGLDAGEAVPVDGGYRGGAINLAARLCSQAGPGEVLASQGVVHLARAVEGLQYRERHALELKGLPDPTPVHLVLRDGDEPGAVAARLEAALAGAAAPRTAARDAPAALSTLTPLLGREVEARALRWTWRRARSGPAHLAVLTGPEGIGKTRLAAEVAATVAAEGARVLYASSLGASAGCADALDAARSSGEPLLLVLDDLEAADAQDVGAVGELLGDSARRLLVVGAYRDDQAPAHTAEALARLGDDDTVRFRLGPLDEDGVRGIAALYADLAGAAVPVERIVAESGGVPALVHRAASAWVHAEAAQRLGEAASQTAEGRSDLRQLEAKLASDVLELQLVEERTRLYSEKTGRDGTDVCPFKGLASFEPADAALFFGRERLVAELVSRLAGARLIGVVGPSGSGKSSVVRAGLIPALGAGVLPDSESWLRVLVRPGEHPLRELDRAVFAAFPDELRGRLPSDGDPLPGALEALPEDARLVVVVDQLEELFTVTSVSEREAFLESIVGAAREPGGRVVVVLALRADFYGRCAEYPALAELLGANTVLVGTMTEEEYRRAIEQPTRRAGLRIDPPLVDALVDEVVDEPGGLPLLSTALLELWQRRDGRALRLAAYEDTGGVRGAVARLAEEAYGTLTPPQQGVARAVLLRLAAGEGESVVRRRVPLAEFDASGSEDVREVLDVFTRDRLVTVSEGTVEVAHEALLREWPRLAEWLDEDREGRRLRVHLTEQAKEWDERGRDTGELYRGTRLAAALDWTTGHTLELNELERDFLDESRTASEHEAERQRRANRRLRVLLIGVAALLALALAAGAIALVARGNAKHSATAAVAQRLGAQALVAKDLDLSLLLARQGTSLDDSLATQGNLEAALVRSPAAVRVFRPLPGRLLFVYTSRDGRYVAVANNAGQMGILDSSTLVTRRRIGDVYPGGFADDGRLMVLRGTPNGPLERVDAIDPASGASQTIFQIPKGTEHFWFGSDLRYAASFPVPGRPTNELTVWSLPGPRPIHRLALTGPKLADIEIASDYLILLRTQTGEAFGPTTVEVWSIAPWRRVTVLHTDALLAYTSPPPYAVDRARPRIAFGHGDGSISVTDLRTGATRLLNGRHNAEVQAVGFSPDGRTIVSTGSDKQVLVWDAASGALRETLTGHGGKVFGPAFSPDGKTVYTVGLDGSGIAWDLGGARRFGRPLRAGSGNDDPTTLPARWFALSPDGRRVATAQLNGRTSIVDLAAGRQVLETKPAPGGRVLDIAWSPDGRTFATAGYSGHVETWSAADGSLARAYLGLPAKVGPPIAQEPNTQANATAVAFSPDGRLLAAASDDNQVYLWEAATGRRVGRPLKTLTTAFDLAFTPDGKELAAAAADVPGKQGGVAFVWRVSDGKLLYRVDIDNGYGLGHAVAFSPDGTLLATGGGNGLVKFWGARSGKPAGRSLLANAGWVLSIAFDPSGRLLVTAGTDGTTRLWDVRRRAAIGAPLPGIEETGAEADFTRDGQGVVSVYNGGEAFLYDLRATSWKRRACSVAGRTLTRDEWAQYLPGRKYDPACR